MQPEYSDEYNENVHKPIKEFSSGNLKKGTDYMDQNYLIIFKEFIETGDMLTNVNYRLKGDSLNSENRVNLSYLSGSLNKILTTKANWLREYSELQKKGKIPTNCSK